MRLPCPVGLHRGRRMRGCILGAAVWLLLALPPAAMARDTAPQPALLRLKVAPGAKLPFSTLTFHVDRPDLLANLAEGDHVGFTAERGPVGNTITRIRKVTPCVRFQACPPIVDE